MKQVETNIKLVLTALSIILIGYGHVYIGLIIVSLLYIVYPLCKK